MSKATEKMISETILRFAGGQGEKPALPPKGGDQHHLIGAAKTLSDGSCFQFPGVSYPFPPPKVGGMFREVGVGENFREQAKRNEYACPNNPHML